MRRAVRCAAVACCLLSIAWACEPEADRRRARIGTGAALSASCTNLVSPSLAPAFVRPSKELAPDVISLNGQSTCTDGFTADGDGNVAVIVRAQDGFDSAVNDASGKRIGAGGRFGSDFRGPWPELEGYDVDDTAANGALLARHFHKNGAKPVTVAIPDVLGFSSARSYDGGQLLVYGAACGGGVCPPGGWSLLAQRISGQGVALSLPSLVAVGTGAFPRLNRDHDPRLFAAVSLGENSLVLWRADHAGSRGKLLGRWIDAEGALLTPPFEVAKSWPATGAVSALPLIGGGVAIQLDGVWVLRIGEGEARPSDPPAFLLQRSHTTVELVHRNTAYAVVTRKVRGATSATDHCSERVEVLAPAGNSCGEVMYPVGEPGRACKAAPVAFGWDGTLIVRSGSCAYRWWPHALE